MSDTQTRNAGLIIAGAILFVAAFINILTGVQVIMDRPNLVQEGYLTAAVNNYAWSTLAFGVIEAVGAVLLLRRMREGAAITYVMVVLGAVYWIAELSVHPINSIVALVVLAATAILVAMNRDQFV